MCSAVTLLSCFLSTIVVFQLLSRVRLCPISATLLMIFLCAVHGIVETDDILTLFISQMFTVITDDTLKSHINFLLTAVVMLLSPKTSLDDRVIPSLIVSDTIIGHDPNGTYTIYEGSFQGQPVAVKRVPREFVTLATREVSILQRYDKHPNVIRYYYHHESRNFIDIALELCPASLADIIENPHGGGSEEWRAIAQKFDKSHKMRAMKQILSGLSHLHRHGIIHGDIKPQNILVSSSEGEYSMLISGFGQSKRLGVDQSSSTSDDAIAAVSSQGGQSTTINSASTPSSSSGTTTPTTKPCVTTSVDISAMGCLFFYILTHGKHPYDSDSNREANIIDDKKVLSPLTSNEAHDLITRMLHPEPSQRPDAQTCLLHPFFWDAEKCLGFLQNASDRFEIMCKDSKDWRLIRLEKDAMSVIGNDWHQILGPVFISHLRKNRGYDGNSVRDLMRALRNKRSHYQDLPDDVKVQLGAMPDGYLKYFTDRFPKLLIHVYQVVMDTGLRDDTMFKTYFEPSGP